MHGALIFALVLIAVIVPGRAFAGPPFFTGDPDPGEYQHWEINTAFQSTHVRGDTSGSAPLMDINYGLLPNVQVQVMPSMAFDNNAAGGRHYGFGDTEFSVKYRFINASEDDWWPQVAIVPTVNTPTGDSSKGLSTTGHLQEFLPVWMEKDFGKWSVYGGGGYWNNAHIANGNYWFSGMVVQRKITDALTLGGELYHQTRDTMAGDPANVASTGFNLGGTYDFNETYHLLFSGGQALDNVASTNAFSCYLGLQTTF